VDIFSMCLAMQGLFILYRASYDILKAYHPTTKFVAIKLVVLIATTQKFLIVVVVPLGARYGSYDRVALINLWNAFLLCIESAIVGRVMYNAFPVSELRRHEGGDAHREYEEGFIEVDLEATAPDDIREIGSRRGSSNPATNPSSPQRQDSGLDFNGLPGGSPPAGKLVRMISVDPLDKQLKERGQDGGGKNVTFEGRDSIIIPGGGRGSLGGIEMMALPPIEGSSSLQETPNSSTRDHDSFVRLPSEPPPPSTPDSLFGKRRILDRSLPLSDEVH